MNLKASIYHTNVAYFAVLQQLAQENPLHAVVRGGASLDFATKLRDATPKDIERLATDAMLLVQPRQELMAFGALDAGPVLPMMLARQPMGARR